MIIMLPLFVWVSNLVLHTKERKMHQNRVLRVIFEPKREEMVGDWRRLHNEELHNLSTFHQILLV